MSAASTKGRRLGAALLVATVGAALAAAPATAYFRDFSTHGNSTPFNSASPKAGLVSVQPCGIGVYFGGGALVSPALPNLALHTAKQFGGYQFGASETDSESANWRATGRASCAKTTNTPPPAGGAATYFKALQIVQAKSATNSSPVKTAIARCPAGKNAIAGGFEISDTTSDVGVWSTTRDQAGRAWRTVAHELDATGASWFVRSQAICANIRTETATADYVAPTGHNTQFNPTTATNSDSPKVLTRTCPAGTYPYAIGGGAGVQTNSSDVIITRSSAGAAGLSNTWVAVARETDPTGASWFLNASITCVRVNGGPPA